MRLHVDQRHERVLELVRERGSLRVAELAEELGMSAVTLRRDVEALAAQGLVERLHGAVVWPTGQSRPAPAAAPPAEGLVVGMVVPTTEYYYADVVRGARQTVEAAGARLTIGLSRYLPDEDAAQARRLLSTGADGLLLTPSWERGCPERGEGLWTAEQEVPVVLVERSAPLGHPAAGLDRVRSDHAHGAAEAVAHLAGLGHRAIALAVQDSPTAPRLRVGYRVAVEALGLTPVSAAPLDDAPSRSEAKRFERTLEYLCEAVASGNVTAAIVHSDADAIVLIPRLQARGVRVPEDLAVIAYDDEVAGLADLPLTAVAPDKHAVGAAAARLLLDRLGVAEPGGAVAGAVTGAGEAGRGSAARRHLDILPTLRIRVSCGAVAAAP
ncbi:substrate-binding domain-containing protein [Streptomyces anulatus]|uniref:substrate-binding domain-containing protein n=1 Tax=Streptomyces anulatus TaxID=1892 RepID=UPI002251EFD0|nr:substrate-binding domain-containing protein [Streptomyces anulatus]MCX4486501.1 substrate-binding domain-containing protein [Streptomyces anulatus]MCX4523479.1 substrate-binding domain-containing protein [Streptomyces anulatus]MCX4606489.1 substrate-binding domain-containing protein [Streptomyces anulatus]WTD14675.1 substrate-binding domain-containing protein [Streptomyces anulatus]WTE07985.1 substrate-binding domain-containing protein [Streptomyces anulatus]